MKETVRLLFVGDIMLNGVYAYRFGTESPKWVEPFLDLKPIFSQADIRIGNLESPLFVGSDTKKKKNSLGAPPGSVEALKYLGFTTLNLANNHITDQGQEGITKTCEILRASNISYFGAGENLNAALRPAVVHKNNISFAFLGYAEEKSDVGAQAATMSREGSAPFSLVRIGRDIAAVRDTVSHVVVSLHWGYQFDQYPEPRQIETARKIIDLGALIVYGHHPHVVQGMEQYRNGIILYSMGNFFSPDFKRADGCWFRFPKESYRSAIAQCEMGTDGVRSVSLVPLLFGPDCRIHLLSGNDESQAITVFDRLSDVLNEANYYRIWSKHHRKTKSWRARTELRLWWCGMAAVWRRIRARGLLASLKKFRLRHLIKLQRSVCRFFRPR